MYSDGSILAGCRGGGGAGGPSKGRGKGGLLLLLARRPPQQDASLPRRGGGGGRGGAGPTSPSNPLQMGVRSVCSRLGRSLGADGGVPRPLETPPRPASGRAAGASPHRVFFLALLRPCTHAAARLAVRRGAAPLSAPWAWLVCTLPVDDGAGSGGAAGMARPGRARLRGGGKHPRATQKPHPPSPLFCPPLPPPSPPRSPPAARPPPWATTTPRSPPPAPLTGPPSTR